MPSTIKRALEGGTAHPALQALPGAALDAARPRGPSRRGPSPRPDLHVHAIGPRGDIVDAQGHFREAYGVEPGDWVLVRPDGYVGAVVASHDLAALEDYLERVGLGAGRLGARAA